MSFKDMAQMTYKFMVRGYNPPADDVQWGIVGADGAVGYSSGSSPTTWTGYRSPADASANDHTDLGYGEDGSGGNRWVEQQATINSNWLTRMILPTVLDGTMLTRPAAALMSSGQMVSGLLLGLQHRMIF